MINLTIYNPKNQKETTAFFIQSKGENLGKVMKSASANCFEVEVDTSILDEDYAFYLIKGVFTAGYFKKYNSGSVIPFITKAAAVRAINDFCETKIC